MFEYIPYSCYHHPEMKDAMKMMFATYLVFNLSYAFKQIDISLKSNTLHIMCPMGIKYTNLMPATLRRLVNTALRTEQEMNFETDTCSIRIALLFGKKCAKDEIIAFFTEVYQNNKKLCNFFTEHSFDEIQALCKKEFRL